MKRKLQKTCSATLDVEKKELSTMKIIKILLKF